MLIRLLLLLLVIGLLLGVNNAYAAPVTSSSIQSKARPAPGDPVRLVIPAIELDRRLLSVGLDRRRVPIVPNHDVGWYNLSARPGQGENVVLWGHVLRFRSRPNIPAPFARLHELQIGDRVTLYTADGTAYRYTVIEQARVTPDQVEYILPRGKEIVTMVSCIGDRVITRAGVEMTHRLITIAAPTR